MDYSFIIFCVVLVVFLVWQGWRIVRALQHFNEGSRSHIDAMLVIHKARQDMEALARQKAEQQENADQATAA